MPKNAGNEIWVYGDLRNERFFGYSLNVAAKAKAVTRSLSGQVAVVLLGAPPPGGLDDSTCTAAEIPVPVAVGHCFGCGVDKVYVLEDAALSVPRADGYAAVFGKVIKEHGPKFVLYALTEFGREMAARTAILNRAGLIAGCIDLRVEKEKLVARCPSWGGEILADIAFSDVSRTGFLTLEPAPFQLAEVVAASGPVERIPVHPVGIPGNVTLVSRSVEPEEHRKLEEARVVVVGGAGLGNAENFGVVRQLAASLGGEVGATRPPVLKHWVDGERLIGQTGKTVRPKLLFSVGTSGAIQYTAAIMESSKIVAINKDPNSPIFQIADFGIVADARSFLPILTRGINRAVMRNLADGFFENDGTAQAAGFGQKLRRLRESKGWTRETLSQAVGQSPEFITQVENDEVSPSVSFLLRLAGTLKVDPGTFLRKEEKTLIRDMRTQALTKRTQNYSYRTLTEAAETNHLHGFLVTIESRQTHKPVAYKHEGEEFIFVLEGDIELTVGSKIQNLKSGESVHFNSDTPHKLKNLSHGATRCLVVLYTP